MEESSAGAASKLPVSVVANSIVLDVNLSLCKGYVRVHNRFDQLTKRLARGGFPSSGRVETDAEVSPDALRIDVWWQPHPSWRFQFW